MSGDEKDKVQIPTLEITPPDKNAPGFLRRQHKLIQFMHRLEEGQRTNSYDPDMISDMVGFLAEFVVEPKDPKEAEEILWDLSEVQYMSVMQQIQGGSDLVPPTKESP